MSRAPNFVVAGVPKAGTTSFHRYLQQHPQIFMSRIKEPTYFGIEDLRRYHFIQQSIEGDRHALATWLAGPQDTPAPHYITEWNDYLALFRHAGTETAIGEASANYFWLPHAAEAIRRQIPATRLVFILRDPADRLFSWYLLDPRRNPEGNFAEWFARELAGRPDGLPSPAVESSRYGTNLERFFAAFPREQILVHRFEEYRQDPRSVLRSTFSFLNVNPHALIDFSTRHNVTTVPRSAFLQRLRRWIPGSESVARSLPTGLRAGVRRLYLKSRSTVAMPRDARGLVIEHYRDEIIRAGEIIEQDLTAWLQPYAG